VTAEVVNRPCCARYEVVQLERSTGLLRHALPVRVDPFERDAGPALMAIASGAVEFGDE